MKNQDWSLVTSTGNTSGWPERLFAMDRTTAGSAAPAASGLGYGLPASVGAAHANKALGRFSVSIQGDGDMMYAPGAVWTAAHHEIPLLTVMHNNRGYHQEVMHVQRLSNRRNRVASPRQETSARSAPASRPRTSITRRSSKSMGWWSEGPITRSEGARPAAQGSRRGGQERPAGASRYRHAAALRSRDDAVCS